MKKTNISNKKLIESLIPVFDRPQHGYFDSECEYDEAYFRIKDYKIKNGIIDEKIINNPIYNEIIIDEMIKNNIIDSLDIIKNNMPTDYSLFWIHSYPILLFALPMQKLSDFGDENYRKKYMSFSVNDGNLVIIEDEFITLPTYIAREIVEGVNQRIIKPDDWSILRVETKRIFDLNGKEIERYKTEYLHRSISKYNSKTELEKHNIGPLSFSGLEKSSVHIIRNNDEESATVYRHVGGRAENGHKACYTLKLENIKTLDFSIGTNNLIKDVTLKNSFNYDENDIPTELSYNNERIDCVKETEKILELRK